MKRPVEQCGWHKRIINDITETYYKGNGSIVSIMNCEEISLEELLAIYNTAKQIKDESDG